MPNKKDEQPADASEVLRFSGPKFEDDQLREIASFDDAIALLGEAGISIDAADQVMGNGFTILATDDKHRLVGVPLLFLAWTFNQGIGGEFVSVMLVAQEPDGRTGRYILNDGSTGIRDQLRDYSNKTGKQSGLAARRGLHRSDYTYTDAVTGRQSPATTYYIDLST